MSETNSPTADREPTSDDQKTTPQAPAKGTGDKEPDKVVKDPSPTADR